MSAIIYRFRVTFEDVDEVERLIEIRAGQSFLDLHNAIQAAIGFDNSKPASFYMSGDNWRMGKEISTEVDRGVAEMKDAKLNQFVIDPHQKILYVTDFEANWTLRVQLVKISRSESTDFPMLVKSHGVAPKQYKPVHTTDISEFDEMVNDLMVDEIPEGVDSPELDEMDEEEEDDFIEEEEEDQN